MEKKEIFKIENTEYVVLETLVYNGINYGFINEIKEDAEIEKYHIVYEENGNINFLADMKLANILIPLFQKKILIDMKENDLLGD